MEEENKQQECKLIKKEIVNDVLDFLKIYNISKYSYLVNNKNTISNKHKYINVDNKHYELPKVDMLNPNGTKSFMK